jgi:hypothetical protein
MAEFTRAPLHFTTPGTRGSIGPCIKGWLYMLSVAPSLLVAFTWWEGLSWTWRIVLFMNVLAAGLAAVACGLIIWERATLFLTSRKEQRRITATINALGDNVQELDIPTAAAIWAGTMETANVERHAHFRGLKNAVDRGLIRPTNHAAPRTANMHTKVDVSSLLDFWRSKGVIGPSPFFGARDAASFLGATMCPVERANLVCYPNIACLPPRHRHRLEALSELVTRQRLAIFTERDTSDAGGLR